MKIVLDLEANGLNPDTIWVIVTKELGGKEEPDVWLDFYKFKEFASNPEITWVVHNGLSYDFRVLAKLLGIHVPIERIVDTFVVSRLVNYTHYSTHSLEELGVRLGFEKVGSGIEDWSKLTDEMIERCKNDVLMTEAVYNQYARHIDNPKWQLSMWCEHMTAALCQKIHENGFYFNATLAKKRLAQMKERLSELEAIFAEAFPPELVPCNRVQYRLKLDGEPYANVSRAIKQYPKTEVQDGVLVCYDYKTFNPGSTKDRIEKLWEAGWKPVEKTDTHYKFSRNARRKAKELGPEEYKKKKEYFDYYGWKVNEDNLETLPSTVDTGPRALAEWLTLEARKRSIEERLDNLDPDFRIRANYWHIGAWTHRKSHSNPNVANISSPWDTRKEPKSPVEEVKAEYDADMRRMFAVESGYLVGTDAESIQLRVLAHYLKNEEYVEAIVKGRKEDETDIHNLNRRALGLNDITRDNAKTFIYAWLLGAGTAKVSRILGCSLSSAKKAVETFIENTTGLGELKRGRIRTDAERGYFEGLDGRKVICSSDYLMLAGYLQNGESVIMKHANILWDKWVTEEGIKFKQVNDVHDEWVTQVYDSEDAAWRVGELQNKSIEETGKKLGLFCPLSGETKVGFTWAEVH